MQGESPEEWKAIMRTWTMETKNLRSLLAKFVMALAIASVIVGTSTGPVLGQDRDRRYGENERDRYDQHDKHHRKENRRYVRPAPPVVYAPPRVVYAPPPVVYAPPPPSPGISFIFPIHIR